MKPSPQRSALRVRPMRRYRKPVYPAYSDPNPLDHPQSVPYPLSRRLVHWTVATGLVTAAATGSAGAQQPAGSPGNPFTLQRTGLPFVPVMYGTGMPERMAEKDIRAAIESAFSQEGIALQAGHLWQGSAGELYLDGYDSISRTGYVFLDYGELGAGTSKRQKGLENLGATLGPSRLEALLDRQMANLFYPDNRRYARPQFEGLKTIAPRWRLDEYERLVQQVEAGDSTLADQRVAENFFLERQYRQDTLLAGPFRQAVEQVLEETNPKKRRALLRPLSLLHQMQLFVYALPGRQALRPGLEHLAEQAVRLANQRPGKRRDARLRTLQQIMEILRTAHYEPGWAPLLENAQRALETRGPGFWPTTEALATEFERYRASMPEIEALDREAKAGRSFIAVLTMKDPHTTLSERLRSYTPPPDSIRKDSNARMAWENEQYRKQAEARLSESRQRLEGEMRRFIQWARGQGRH